MNVLFVCSGNTCRSPMAAYLGAALAQKKYPGKNFRFDSCGIATSDGYPPSENSVLALAEAGIDMEDHRSQRFQHYLFALADYVVCMTDLQKKAILREYPGEEKKVFVIGELSGTGKDVPDPYGKSLDFYRKTRDVLISEISAVLDRLADTEEKK